MYNLETLTTLGTQDSGRRQTNEKTKQPKKKQKKNNNNIKKTQTKINQIITLK